MLKDLIWLMFHPLRVGAAGVELKRDNAATQRFASSSEDTRALFAAHFCRPGRNMQVAPDGR